MYPPGEWGGEWWVPRVERPDGTYVPLLSLDGVTWALATLAFDRYFSELFAPDLLKGVWDMLYGDIPDVVLPA